MQLVGNGLQSGRALMGQRLPGEAGNERALQPANQLVVNNIAGNELPPVEALEIGQQQFHLRQDNALAERVNGDVVFLANALHQVGHHGFFFI